jgi:polyisoprenoid-binding protein YceI
MSTAIAESTITYQLDPAHSRAHFSVRHMMISHVRGEFSGLTGSLVFDPANPAASTASVEIDVASISTGQAQRDEHLHTGDFFDVAAYPKITFASTAVAITGDETAKLTGDLTIHGVTKQVTLDVEGTPREVNDLYGNRRLGFTAKTRIKRSDFGLTYNAALETGGVVISDDVDITIDVQFMRPASA